MSASRIQAAIDRAHTVHGRAATWTKQSTSATTEVTVILRGRRTGGLAEFSVKSADLASAPVRDDSFVMTGQTERWYVVAVSESLSIDGDYALECKSNAAE